jgi:hypothetical protein
MGEKKQKAASGRKWNKIIAIIVGVLFVVLMVVSAMGSSWINSLAVAKPGDIVTVDYTLYDSSGNPIVTTNQQVFENAMAKGSGMIYSKQMSIIANQSYTNPIYPVQVYTVGSGWGNNFAIFSREYDAVSAGIVGMKANDKKTIALPATDSMTQLWTPEQLTRNGVNLSVLRVGDVIAMGVSDNPSAMMSNSSALTDLRIAEVTQKSDAGALVNFGYPKIDISVASINTKH